MNATRFDNMRERYISFFGKETASDGAVDAIESALNLLLPDDLKEIGTFYRGGILGGKSHNALEPNGPATNVVDETLRLRAATKLPHRFVVLAEPANSLIVLDTESRATGAPAVIWCDANDAVRLDDVSAMATPPETWPSYSAFFECLLDEEEEERGDV
jgi:hypothetical protein